MNPAENYAASRRVMADGDHLPVRFEYWLKRAEEIERRLAGKAEIVIRAVIDPGEFPRWCAARSLDSDSEGRRRFAAWVAPQRAGQTH